MRIDKKIIESLLKKDDNNQIFIDRIYKDECLNEIEIIKAKIKELKDQRKGEETINLSIKQCTTFQKNRIKIYI